MQLFFTKKPFVIFYFLSAFLLLSSCDSRGLFAFSNNKIQEIEKEDHQFCISHGLDFGEDALKNEIYWRCRITLAKGKIKNDALLPEEIRLNITIKQLIADISKNYSDSYERWGDSRNSLFDNNDHNSCITLGHDIDSPKKIASATMLEDYFICRKRLISNQQIIPPYRKTEYFKRPQDSYNIGFAINKKTDKDIAKFEAAKAKYPVCVKFNLKSEEFKSCSIDYDDQRQCLSNISNLRFKRELFEKTACQKKSYIRFPDSMLKKDDKKAKELASVTYFADSINNSSFASIGIDKSQLEKFGGSEKEGAKPSENISEKLTKALKDSAQKPAESTEKKDKKITLAKSEEKAMRDLNTKNNLYTKVDLTKLRRQFIFLCQEATNPDLESYSAKLQNECNAIVEKWESAK